MLDIIKINVKSNITYAVFYSISLLMSIFLIFLGLYNIRNITLDLNINNLITITSATEGKYINKTELNNIIKKNNLSNKINYIDYCIDEENGLFYREYLNTNILYEINFNNNEEYKIILSFQFEENNSYLTKETIKIENSIFQIIEFTNINKNFVNKKYFDDKNLLSYKYIDIETNTKLSNDLINSYFNNYNVSTYNSKYFISPIINKGKYYILSFFLGLIICILTLINNNYYNRKLYKILYLLGMNTKELIKFYSINAMFLYIYIFINLLLMIVITKSFLINVLISLIIYIFIFMIDIIMQLKYLIRVKNEKTY